MLSEAVKEYKTQQLNQIKHCIVGEWVNDLSKEDQEVFTEVQTDYSISNRNLHSILKNAGGRFSIEALRKHRNQECPCQA